MRYQVRFDDVAELEAHGATVYHPSRRERQWGALCRAAALLRRACVEGGRPSDVHGMDDEALAKLLLRIKFNSHPVYDATTMTTKLGIALFPARRAPPLSRVTFLPSFPALACA